MAGEVFIPGSQTITAEQGNGFVRFGNKGQIGLELNASDSRPYTLAQQKVEGGLKQQSWEQALQILSTTNDVFEVGMADAEINYANMGISIPDAIGMRMSAGGQNSVHTFPVLDPITGLPIAGTTSLQGKEKGQNMRYVQAYYNEVKDGLATEQYGVGYNYENAFGMYENATNQLTKYWAETKGRMKRECLVEWYNRELTVNNPGATLTQHLNPNWFINGNSVTQTVSIETVATADGVDAATTAVDGVVKITTVTGATTCTVNGPVVDGAYYRLDDKTAGAEEITWVGNSEGDLFVGQETDDNGVPNWDPTLATFENRVADALKTGGADSGTTDLLFFDKISYYAKEYLIESLDDNTYIVTVPMPVWYKLTQAPGDATNAGSFATYFTAVTEYANGTDAYPGEMGRYRDLRIVPDERWVGCEVAADSITLEYKLPGNEDNRNKSAYVTTTNEVFQLGFLLGKGAYIERMEKDLYFKYDIQNYEQQKGIGTFMECGYNLNIVKYDPTGSNEFPDYAENRSSAVLAFPGVRF